MRVSLVSDSIQLTALADDWNRLAGGVPFRTHAWLASWWEHYGHGKELCVLVVRDAAEQVVGILPLCSEPSAAKGRTLAFLGSGEVCSDYLGILTEPALASAVVEALAQWLSEDQTLAWDLLQLSGLVVGDEPVTQLAQSLTTAGLTVRERPGLNCWRIALPSEWENYIESLSKSHRKQVRRVDRRLVESGEATLHCVRELATLPQGLEILIDLHQRRRHSLGEPGCFADPRFTGFLQTAAPRLLALGMLRLYWVELGGKPVAAEFQLAGGGVTFAYQAGVDPDMLDEEPGRIINIATLKQAILDGQQGFDFLRGDEPYKAHWRAEPQPCLELRIVPRKTAAQLRHGMWLAGDAVKQMIKNGLNLTGAK